MTKEELKSLLGDAEDNINSCFSLGDGVDKFSKTILLTQALTRLDVAREAVRGLIEKERTTK